MAKVIEIAATVREQVGTLAMRRLRRTGQAPAVIYGHGEPTVPLTVPAAAIGVALARHAQMLEVVVGGARQTVLVRAPQWEVTGDRLLHIDFVRIASDETVEVRVPLVLKGPAVGEKEGGVLAQAMHEVTVACLPRDIPERVEASVVDLKLGDVLRARDLALPPGVTLKLPPDAALVSVARPTVLGGAAPAAETGAAAAAAPAAEPEVIKPERKPEDEEEEAGK